MKQIPLIIAAILFNVGAQIFIKHAGKSGVGASGIASWISPWIVLAASLYGLSFFFTVRIFAVNDLSTVSPVMAGGAFVLVAVSGVFLFGEIISISKLLGMFAIGLGIYLLSNQ
jgi:multidrug transporter EmrE-like cation transporter